MKNAIGESIRMITCIGFHDGKYLIEEHDPHIRLVFEGPDAHRFEQANQPRGRIKNVGFRFTVRELREQFPGFLPTTN